LQLNEEPKGQNRNCCRNTNPEKKKTKDFFPKNKSMTKISCSQDLDRPQIFQQNQPATRFYQHYIHTCQIEHPITNPTAKQIQMTCIAFMLKK